MYTFSHFNVFFVIYTLQDCQPSLVVCQGEEVPIKRITMADQTDTGDSIEVTLWRDHSNLDIKTGDYIKVTNVDVGFFQQTKNLSTNQLSTIQVRLNNVSFQV